MPIDIATPWHKESFDRFLDEGLPRLLAERLPLAGYRVEPEGTYTCRVSVTLATGDGELPLVYSGFPQPDQQGVFEIDGGRRIVIPLASTEELDVADVCCAGEQLYDYIAERLGQAPAHLPWDAALARVWLPLDAWARDFLTPAEGDFSAQVSRAQWPDQTNWLALRTNLRRLVVRERQRLFTPGQLGRTCPFEVPEGPNMGRIFTIAAGAAIRDGRLVVLDDRPEATLGPSASMIPFLEHDEPPRLLMGANMLRQWLPPPDPEPALVQTGNEPDAPEFWCGRNLLTAYVSWDGDTFEDGIVISESCARRLGYPRPVEPGDKFSNRHGAKGVISRILPDDQMPHLADGTPVELLYSFMSLPSRMYFGQVREAVMGRIARAEGRPAIVPPFRAPSADELRERLARAGLPTDGMETLTQGRGGPPLARPSAVGWVYWGKLVHVASDKLRVWTGEPDDTHRSALEDSLAVGTPLWVPGQGGQHQGEPEYYALRQAGAFQTIVEQYNTRAADRADAGTLAARLAAGQVAQAGAPSPIFVGLARRLAAAGIRADLDGERLALNFMSPADDALRLAQPVAHPWLPERALDVVGALPDLPEYAALVEANARLARLFDSQAPAALAQQAVANLEARVGALFEALLRPEHLRFEQRALFSARAVAAPGPDLPVDRVGLAEEIAWRLFGPLLARELGDREAIRRRDERAVQALDELMERSWVIINRKPSVGPQAFLAFRPLRIPDRVIRLPLLACNMLNTDFDGDQLALFLPITEVGQREAAERLTVAAHLARDPSLLEEPRPRMDALLGLALLSLTPEGRAEIDRLAGAAVPTPDGFVTRWAELDAMRAALERGGPKAALELSERLMRRGFEVARASGASIGPFVGAEFRYPPTPRGDDPAAWDGYVQELIERIAAHADFSGDFGVLALAAKSGARSNLRQIAWTIGARGAVTDVAGRRAVVRHSYRDGLEPGELFALVAGARAGLNELLTEWERMGRAMRERMGPPRGYGALARAMRSPRPGVVFALAAAAGEVDPLAELDSRLFVGLPAAG
jgi:hypothetical protein